MKYKAGKIAEILGVSIETIRNYEKIGLLHPERDRQNGYRLYDAIEVNVLRRARSYAGFGMSMRESVDLIMNGSVADLAQKLAEQSKKIQRQIEYDLLLFSFTQEKQRHLSRIAGADNEVVIENCPSMLALIYRDGLTFRKDDKVRTQYHRWNQYHPFTEASIHYEQGSFFSPDYTFSHGLLIEETYTGAFGIAPSDVVRRFPQRRCLYTCTSCSREPQSLLEEPLQSHIIEVMRQRNLQIAGDPFARVLHTGGSPEGYRHYMELWVPIE